MEENKDKLLKQESEPTRESDKVPEQMKKEESEVAKEDLKIKELKEKIDDLKKAKRERIAKEKKKERRKREHYLIKFGAEVTKMLAINDMLSDEDVEKAKNKIRDLLSMEGALNKYNLYSSKHIYNYFNKRSGMNDNDR